MATNNSINSLDPIQVGIGGTGNSTLSSNGVLYGNGTAAIGVTSGTSTAGFVLTSNGAGVAPTFQNFGAGGSGNMTLIQTLTASNSASLVFAWTPGSYIGYFITITNIVPVTNAVSLSLSAGTSKYENIFQYNSASYSSVSALSGTISNTANIGISGYLFICGVTTTTASMDGQVVYQGSATSLPICGVFGATGVAQNINTLTFSMSSGNISSGTINLYGITG